MFGENTFFGDTGRRVLNRRGGFVYAVQNKPISAGHTKTGAYVDENRKLDARFRVTGFQELVETNASAQTAQLQSIMVVFAATACRRWDIRAMDVSRTFLRSAPLKRATYAKFPGGAEKAIWHGSY